MGKRRAPYQPLQSFLLADTTPWSADLETLRLPLHATSLLDDAFMMPELDPCRLARIEARLSLYTREELEEGDAELDCLVRAFMAGIRNASGKVTYALSRRRPGQPTGYETAQYLTDRNAFFGSRLAFRDYLAIGREELNADGGKLRNQVEPSLPTKNWLAKHHSGGRLEPDWRDAQDVFYAWVRRAYQQQNGPSSSLAYAIKQGKSEKLSAALGRVRCKTNIAFHAGGYNPRPKKMGGGYRLGTLSEHATGAAIDVDDAANAQLENWDKIESYTGIRLPEATRKVQWKSAPQQLHAAITQINNAFVVKLRAAIAKEVEGGAAPGKALEAAIEHDPQLKAIGLGFLIQWQGGFFALPWSLVSALRDEGLTWGATFKTPDLHHFEFQ
jgi:hypothetical protein